MIHFERPCSTSTLSYDFEPDHVFEVEKVEPPPGRSKQRPPVAKRVAKRRRKTALAKHHKKVLKLIAAGVREGFPRRPPKPKGKT